MDSTEDLEFYYAKDWIAEIEGLTEIVKEKDRKILYLEGRVSDKNVEIKSLQRKLTKMDDYIGQLKGDLRRLDKDNTDLRDKRRRMISEIETWERSQKEKRLKSRRN